MLSADCCHTDPGNIGIILSADSCHTESGNIGIILSADCCHTDPGNIGIILSADCCHTESGNIGIMLSADCCQTDPGNIGIMFTINYFVHTCTFASNKQMLLLYRRYTMTIESCYIKPLCKHMAYRRICGAWIQKP